MTGSQTSMVALQPAERIYVSQRGVGAANDEVQYSGSAQSKRNGISRFGAFAAPLAAAAMLFGGVPAVDRRIFAGSTSLTAHAQEMVWLLGTEWAFTQTYVTDVEMEALNDLYHFSAPEGIFLSLPDA